MASKLLQGLQPGDLVHWKNPQGEVKIYPVQRIFANGPDEMFADTEVWLGKSTVNPIQAPLHALDLAMCPFKYTARLQGFTVERSDQNRRKFYWRSAEEYGEAGEDVASERAAWEAACRDNELTVYGT